MLGRRVKWKNSFREFEGTVVEVHGEKCTIFEFTDLEEYCVVQQQLTLWQPDCSRYASYLRKKLDNPSFETGKNLTIHDLVISVLESLSGDQTFQRSKKDAIEHEMRLKSAAARVNLNSESDEKFACMFYSKLSPQSKAVQAAHCKDAMAPERSPNKTVQKEEADSDEHSSDESGSDDPDGSDNDNDSSDSESDNSSEDEDEDEDDTSDSEEQESEDDDEKIDIKIYVLPNDDVRGFSVRLSDAGLKTMQKALKKDYSAFPHIFFRDSDGDALAVKSAHDLRYAYRATKSQLSTGEVIKLKLFAEVGDVAAAAPAKWRLQQHRRGAPTGLTTSSNISVDSLSPTVHFADKISMTNGEVGISGLHALTASSKEGGGGSGAHSPARAALNFEVLWKRGELLGSGSFGKVFSGINLATGERMAVKEVALRRSKKHKQQVQALQLEVKILSSLDHPNIIKYFGTEFTKHTLRIFLELANDGTVKDALNEFGECLCIMNLFMSYFLEFYNYVYHYYCSFRRFPRATGAALCC